MARHPLYAAELKTKWAKKHIAQLMSDHAIWGNDPYAVFVENDPQTGEIVEKGRRAFELNFESVFEHVSGSIVNLRSALDYLAFEIWRITGDQSISEREIQFPIKGRREDFIAPKHLAFIERMFGKRGRAFIEAAQPYPIWQGAEGNRQLAILNTLAGIEKHRHPVRITYDYPVVLDDFGRYDPARISIALEEADDIIELGRYPSGNYPHANVKPAGKIAVQWIHPGQGERLAPTLYEIAQTVDGLLKKATIEFFPS